MRSGCDNPGMGRARVVEMEPIGTVRSGRREASDDDWDTVKASIGLDERRFGPEALLGLETFSHVEIIYLFDRVGADQVEMGARRPRGNQAWPEVGIFAQRARGRPNRIGTTICQVLAVDGLNVSVRGLDAIDGTPVLDIKPWMPEFGPRGAIRRPAWSQELMAGYW